MGNSKFISMTVVLKKLINVNMSLLCNELMIIAACKNTVQIQIGIFPKIKNENKQQNKFSRLNFIFVVRNNSIKRLPAEFHMIGFLVKRMNNEKKQTPFYFSSTAEIFISDMLN